MKGRLTRWVHENFDITREGQLWNIQSRSGQGCLWLLAVVLPVMFICLGYTIFLFFKIYPIVFSTLIKRLGIASWLGIPLLITAFLGCYINLPLFIFTKHHQSTQQVHYLGINVTGGLIPIILALYQFHRSQPSAILLVTAIVALTSYFIVTVIPGRAIVMTFPRFWLITAVAVLSAMVSVAGGVNRPDVSVAFAGAVLGTTLGADLLHLKDVRPDLADTPLSIGGAGFDDGIAQCGLFALIIAEWLPAVTTWLSTHFHF